MADINQKRKEFLEYVAQTHLMGQMMERAFREVEEKDRYLTPAELNLIKVYKERHKKIEEAAGAHPGNEEKFQKK